MSVAKISPRQKMINVMYLILTDMLALNVSSEILKAFFLMETSMDMTSENVQQKNRDLLVAYDRQLGTQPDLVRPFYVKAKEAEKLAAEFDQYVENLKNILIEETGGREESSDGKKTELVGKDDIEKHADFLINKKKGDELKIKISEIREKLLALLAPEERNEVISDLVAQDYGTQSWESFHFEHSPLAEVVAMMSKIQNDCKVTTNDVLKTLYQHIGGTSLPIDKIEAAIVPKSNYLMKGDEFTADIFLTAHSTRQAHEIYIDGQKVAEENGKFTYRVPSNITGSHTINGEIWVRESDSLRKYPFSTAYNVFNGGASVSADNTRILYTDIDNPLSITAPGIAPSNLKAEVDNVTLVSEAESKYNVKVSRIGTNRVKVLARDDYGNWKPMGQEQFLVRNLPKPEIRYGTLDGSTTYSKGAVLAQRMMVAGLGGIYVRGLHYSVKSYTMSIADSRNGIQSTIQVNGQYASGDVQAALNRMAPGSIVIFENIKVDKMPRKTFQLVLRTR